MRYFYQTLHTYSFLLDRVVALVSTSHDFVFCPYDPNDFTRYFINSRRLTYNCLCKNNSYFLLYRSVAIDVIEFMIFVFMTVQDISPVLQTHSR